MRNRSFAIYSLSFLFFLSLVGLQLSAHTINYALEKAPGQQVLLFYGRLGIQHIIPYGLDHILFVTGLCLMSTRIKPILWQATAFTIAHSITLALSMKNVIVAPPAIVEPLIALSILFVAVENLLISGVKIWRVIIVFFFGLVHGMGFASALNEIGLPRNKFFLSVLSFNIGVELGQICVIAAVFGLLIIPLRNKSWYRNRVVYTLSALIGITATWWTVERMMSM